MTNYHRNWEKRL